ncbi:MAG TPA: 30S ribosomal protein S17 [Anaerolineae bacterium]|nr:30S ribosomal protein S17 [Anaerolineae bacterium]HIQ05229.1 30S ribosomal protein S17 [Anaerolineae bacterium]
MREQRKQLVGTVTSDKMDKTVVVEVERRRRHPLYGKVVRTWKRYMAHDEHNECREGDVVRILEARPLSRRKRWVVTEIIRRAEAQ